MNFNFIAPHIIFGAGKSKTIHQFDVFGTRALLVIGRSPDRQKELIRLLHDEFIVRMISIESEPTIPIIREAVDEAKAFQANFIIAIGGGSVIDAAKAIAALATNPHDILDYLEVIGKGKPLQNDPLPSVAIPTTAGTGSEVTKNAVIQSPEHRVKVSLRHDRMIPNLAIIDPLLTHSMPPEVTAATGLDAFTQLVEPFISHLANPLTDALCREGIKRTARSLKKVYENGTDAQARQDMAIASVFGGLALANAKLGAVHGFAGPIGGMFEAPHGAVCAALLPHVLAMNALALEERQPESPALAKLQELASLLLQKPDASIQEGVDWVQTLCTDLKVKSLQMYGIQKSDFEQIAEKAEKAGSMKGNPIHLTRNELLSILQQAF